MIISTVIICKSMNELSHVILFSYCFPTGEHTSSVCFTFTACLSLNSPIPGAQCGQYRWRTLAFVLWVLFLIRREAARGLCGNSMASFVCLKEIAVSLSWDFLLWVSKKKKQPSEETTFEWQRAPGDDPSPQGRLGSQLERAPLDSFLSHPALHLHGGGGGWPRADGISMREVGLSLSCLHLRIFICPSIKEITNGNYYNLWKV